MWIRYKLGKTVQGIFLAEHWKCNRPTDGDRIPVRCFLGVMTCQTSNLIEQNPSLVDVVRFNGGISDRAGGCQEVCQFIYRGKFLGCGHAREHVRHGRPGLDLMGIRKKVPYKAAANTATNAVEIGSCLSMDIRE